MISTKTIAQRVEKVLQNSNTTVIATVMDDNHLVFLDVKNQYGISRRFELAKYKTVREAEEDIVEQYMKLPFYNLGDFYKHLLQTVYPVLLNRKPVHCVYGEWNGLYVGFCYEHAGSLFPLTNSHSRSLGLTEEELYHVAIRNLANSLRIIKFSDSYKENHIDFLELMQSFDSSLIQKAFFVSVSKECHDVSGTVLISELFSCLTKELNTDVIILPLGQESLVLLPNDSLVKVDNEGITKCESLQELVSVMVTHDNKKYPLQNVVMYRKDTQSFELL